MKQPNQPSPASSGLIDPTSTPEEQAAALEAFTDNLPTLWAARARASLGFYGEYVLGYRPAAHHQQWIDVLEDPRNTRVLFIAPPGHAKSTWINIIYPSWYLGQHSENHVLSLSGTGSLASGFSQAVRDTTTTSLYRQVFPDVQPDMSKGWAADAWFLKRPNRSDPHPTCRGVGVFGPAIGRRGDLIIVDDPHDDQTAYSDIKRAHVKRWMHQVVLSRARPNARVVVILTRWHLDDLGADLINEGWLVIHQPAISADNKALWPEEFPLEKLHDIRREQGDAIFAAMYQGDPSALGSLIFTDRHFRRFETTPTDYVLWRRDESGNTSRELVPRAACYMVQVADPAIGLKQDNDYTVIATAAVTPRGERLIVDVRRERIPGPEQRGAIVQAFNTWRPIRVGVERTAYQFALVQDLRKHTGLPIVELLPDKDKRARALRPAALYQSEKIFHPLPEAASWVTPFEMELLGFPVSKHDDQVDALAYLCELSDLPGTGVLEWYRKQFAKIRRSERIQKGLPPDVDPEVVADALLQDGQPVRWDEFTEEEALLIDTHFARLAAEYVDKGDELRATMILIERQKFPYERPLEPSSEVLVG